MDITSQYRKLNRSFRKTLIYHVGIDAGFFTEYTYMINAMLWCLQNKVQFKLYSADANFGYSKGWTDYFDSFCEETTDELHHRYNTHPIPSFINLLKLSIKRHNANLLKWKIKVTCNGIIGRFALFVKYGNPILLNQNIKFRHDTLYNIPELGIVDCNYIDAFNKMVDITWNLNKDTKKEVNRFIESLSLPDKYTGCQVRGGDKVTEVNLLEPEYYADKLKNYSNPENVFVLTDDYKIYSRLCKYSPHTNWFTLCKFNEDGYVNSKFTNISSECKREQMVRFIASMEVLKKSENFLGSITPGPSLFLFKRLYPNIKMIDCHSKDFMNILKLPITKRGEIAEAYLNNHK